MYIIEQGFIFIKRWLFHLSYLYVSHASAFGRRALLLLPILTLFGKHAISQISSRECKKKWVTGVGGNSKSLCDGS